MKIDHIETLLSCGDYADSDDWKATRERIHEAVRAVDWPVNTGSFTINPVDRGNGVKPIKTVFVERLQAQGWATEAPIKLATDPNEERRSTIVKVAWEEATNGQEFKDNLEASGYGLALSNRSLVVVDENAIPHRITNSIGANSTARKKKLADLFDLPTIEAGNLDIQPGNLDFMLKSVAGPIAIEWETGNVSSCHRSMNKLALGLTQGAIAAGIMIVPSRRLYKYLTDRIANYGELRPYLPYWRALQCKNGIFEIVSFEHDAKSSGVELIPKGMDGNAPKPAKSV